MVKIKTKINDKIATLNETLNVSKSFDSYFSAQVKSELDKIHNDFVLVPIDKATGNIALICKRFYASVIVKELGLENSSCNATYNVINDSSKDSIILKNIQDLQLKFGVKNVDDHIT